MYLLQISPTRHESASSRASDAKQPNLKAINVSVYLRRVGERRGIGIRVLPHITSSVKSSLSTAQEPATQRPARPELGVASRPMTDRVRLGQTATHHLSFVTS